MLDPHHLAHACNAAIICECVAEQECVCGVVYKAQ